MNNSKEGSDVEAIERLFSPEFRNRLDAVIPFNYLKIEVITSYLDGRYFEALRTPDRNYRPI